MMDTADDEHEQPVVPSSSSPHPIVESLDQYLEKPEHERVLTPELDQLLVQIAKTGCTSHPWDKVRPLFVHKLIQVLDEFNAESNMDKLETHPNVDPATFDELKADILERIDSFDNAPFTIQRLCELVTSPRLHYRRTDKFIRGITKCVCVVTTIDNDGNKIYLEPTRVTVSMVPPSSISITNGFAIPHDVLDMIDMGNCLVDRDVESQETQAGSSSSINNTQLDEEMEQEDDDEDEDEDEEELEKRSSPIPVVDESSSSSNSNSTPVPSTSTEDSMEGGEQQQQ